MKIPFHDKETEKTCTDYKYMNRVLQPKTAARLRVLMTILDSLPHMSDFGLPALQRYRYHELSGDKKGIKSLSIDYAYRMTLTIELLGTNDRCDEIMILEVSNHYGD